MHSKQHHYLFFTIVILVLQILSTESTFGLWHLHRKHGGVCHHSKQDQPVVQVQDLCAVNNGGCGPYATCSYDRIRRVVSCLCNPGYVNIGSQSATQCIGICDHNNGGCGPYATCSYDVVRRTVDCKCKPGYINVGTQNSVQCIPICDHNNGGCGSYATCSYDGSRGVVNCRCKAGYVNAGTQENVRCIPVCNHENGGCGSYATCSYDETKDTVLCKCQSGYVNTGTRDKFACKDACDVNNGDCGDNAVCSHHPNTNAVVCTCKPGFVNVGSHDNVICKPRGRTDGIVYERPHKQRRKSRPIEFNFASGHLIEIKDGTIYGIITVKWFRPSLFLRKQRRCSLICNYIQDLLKNYLNENGITKVYPVQFVKVSGTYEELEFHYKIPCAKSHIKIVSRGLTHIWEQRSLVNIFTAAKQPDSSESSSECDEH